MARDLQHVGAGRRLSGLSNSRRDSGGHAHDPQRQVAEADGVATWPLGRAGLPVGTQVQTWTAVQRGQRTMRTDAMVANAAPLILVVDDTPALLDVVRKCLEGEGYRVVTCLESRHAVRLASEQPPDVIMLDVVMPEVSGWEVLAELRADARFARTPVIVCTAYVAEALGRLAELRGPDQHLGLLPKPFEIEELIEVVASVAAAAVAGKAS